MKKIRITLLLVLIATLALSSCTSKQSEEQAATEAPSDYPAPEQGEPPKKEETPDSGQESYPEPPQAVVELPTVLYPFMEEGGELTWLQAEAVIHNGEVVEVVQTQSLKVLLTLKDGRVLITFEPEFDAIIKSIEICGDKCKDIIFSNE